MPNNDICSSHSIRSSKLKQYYDLEKRKKCKKLGLRNSSRGPDFEKGVFIAGEDLATLVGGGLIVCESLCI